MAIDRGLVLEQQGFVGPMRDRHDVDVAEFRARLAPVTVSKNVMPPDFSAGFHFTTGWDCPVEERIESRDAHAGGGGLDVLEKSRKTADDFARVKRFGDPAEFFRIESGFRCARAPG
jgi:hypothetical protein